MRITSKGQVTIPADICERAGLLPHTAVEFELDGKVVRIVRAKAGKKDGRGARVVAQLRRRGDVAMSTDESPFRTKPPFSLARRSSPIGDEAEQRACRLRTSS